VVLAFAANDWMILGAAALLGFGVGTVQSCGLAMAVRVTSDARLSVANATFYMLLDVGVGIGPILLGIVALNTLLLPAFSIGVLRWFRVIPDWSLQDQKTRMLPMGIVAVCYLMCIVAMSNMLFAFLITRFLIAALCCVAFAFFVNLYWKISLHMTAAGGLLGMLAVVCYAGLANLQQALVGCLLLAGLLGSARLRLGSHNLAQVAAGAGGGAVISVVVILFF